MKEFNSCPQYIKLTFYVRPMFHFILLLPSILPKLLWNTEGI